MIYVWPACWSLKKNHIRCKVHYDLQIRVRLIFQSINNPYPTVAAISMNSETLQLICVFFSPSCSFCSGCDHQQQGFITHTWGPTHGPKCDPKVLTSRPRFGHAGPPPSLLPGTPHFSALLPVFQAAFAGKDKLVCQEDNTHEPVVGCWWERLPQLQT